MSYVTTILLHVGGLEDNGGVTLETVNQWIREYDSKWAEMRPLDEAPSDYWGGQKHPQVTLWATAANYFQLDDFMVFLAGCAWKYPREVQLFVNKEHDDRFAVYMLKDDKSWRMLVDGSSA